MMANYIHSFEPDPNDRMTQGERTRSTDLVETAIKL